MASMDELQRETRIKWRFTKRIKKNTAAESVRDGIATGIAMCHRTVRHPIFRGCRMHAKKQCDAPRDAGSERRTTAGFLRA